MASKSGSSGGGTESTGTTPTSTEKQSSFDSFFTNNDELTYAESGESEYFNELTYKLGKSIGELSDEVLNELTDGMTQEEFEEYMNELSVTDEDLEFANGDEGWYDQAYDQVMPSGDSWLVRNDAQEQFFRRLDKKLHP